MDAREARKADQDRMDRERAVQTQRYGLMISDEQVMEVLAVAQRLKPNIFKAMMYVILRTMPREEYREFMQQLYDDRKESGR